MIGVRENDGSFVVYIGTQSTNELKKAFRFQLQTTIYRQPSTYLPQSNNESILVCKATCNPLVILVKNQVKFRRFLSSEKISLAHTLSSRLEEPSFKRKMIIRI
jgi:hypothetical protein